MGQLVAADPSSTTRCFCLDQSMLRRQVNLSDGRTLPKPNTRLRLAQTSEFFGLVLDDSRVIGRIFLAPQAPPERKWMWRITTPEKTSSIRSHGYSATRQQALSDLGMRWLT